MSHDTAVSDSKKPERKSEIVIPILAHTRKGSLAVKWFGGVTDPRGEGAKFFFLLPNDTDILQFDKELGHYQAVFLGPIRLWPVPEAVSNIVESFDGMATPNTTVLYFTNPYHPIPHEKLIQQPLCGVERVLTPAESIFGPAHPKFYSDQSVLKRAKDEVHSRMPWRAKLLFDPKTPLPEDRVPWRTSWENCSECAGASENRSNTFVYVCEQCGRRWFQYNRWQHLWRHVTSLEEWERRRREAVMNDPDYKP